MKCKNIIKKSGIAYMIDTNNEELDIQNFRNIDLIEKNNGVIVMDLLNDFIKSKDNSFNEIIDVIEKMVDRYPIDYYVYGDGNEVSEDSVALMYNLKNRKSNIDCNMKVFYSEKYNKISYRISFEQGASGQYFGYQFYKFFTIENFYEIEKMLRTYFMNNDGINDRIIIKELTNNVESYVGNYYSE